MSDDDRKYRQRGYHDSGERRTPQSRGPQAPRPKPEGPRGRGLGAPTEAVFRCAACGAKRLVVVAEEGKEIAALALDATCAGCGRDMHTCTHCIHFDTASRWECRHAAELPARVVKKSTRNDCPLWSPKIAQEFAADRDRPASTPSDARAAFDALFKS